MRVDLLAGPAGVANVIGSAFIVSLGILVLLPRPRGRPQWSFALLAWGIGVGAGATNLVFPDDPGWTAAMWGILGVGHVVAFAGLLGVVGSVTGRLRAWDWMWGGGAFAVIAAVSHVGFFLGPGPTQAFAATGYPVTPALVPSAVAATLTFAALWSGAFVLARLAVRHDASGRGQAAMLSSSLIVYPAAIATGDGLAYPTWRWLALGAMVAAVLLCAAWLVPTRGGRWRPLVWAALVPPVVVTLGLLLGAADVRWSGGASRIALTGLVAFAILRYHALGIDAKLRFGISKSAVAAVFVGVFFAASELAQQFFGEQSGNAYYGIGAAGLLVIAIAPLQRLADRLAVRAVPLQDAGPNRTVQEEIYHEAVQAASRDGVVTRREEIHLARIADRLGIGAERALQLRGPDLGQGPRRRR